MSSKEHETRRELNMWEEDFNNHLESCPICDDEAKEYCPRGQRMQDIMMRLTGELMREALPRMVAEGDAMFPRRAERQARRQGQAKPGKPR